MKVKRALLASLAAALLGVTTAHADSFSFSFGSASDVFAGSGIVTGNPNALGNFLITEISGTTRTTPGGSYKTITSLEPVGAGIYHDNVVGVTGGYSFDSAGLSYLLNDGTQVVLFGSIGAYLQVPDRPTIQQIGPITVVPVATVATTPEPGSFVLLGTGLLGVVVVARRRFSA